MSPTQSRWLFTFAVAAITACLIGKAPTPHDRSRSGGDLTVHDTSSKAFAKPAPNLPPRQLRQFAFGDRLFNTNWVTAPASVKSLDGLGPVFNRVSCSGCHLFDGRGKAPEGPDQPMTSMLVRLSLPGQTDTGAPQPHPAYGGQLNDRAIHNVPAEGRASVDWVYQTGTYADGQTYQLRRPKFTYVDMAFGPLSENTLTSPRVAPAVFGLGLLEAIDEQTLRNLADPDDANGDGISGRPNYPWDIEAGTHRIGRFGWKANQPTLRQQNASAFLGDIGITSTMHPNENVMPVQTAAAKAPSGNNDQGVELSDTFLERITFYTQTLAVPARRDVDHPDVLRGEQLFTQINCASCHQPTLRTGNTHPVEQLRNQTIHPYTNLLLHDMGEGLADNRPDFEATGQEWRTPPLWGLGLIERVNGHTHLLHDGRARNIEEAILWHGGEAQKSRDAFIQLPLTDRNALVRFISSL